MCRKSFKAVLILHLDMHAIVLDHHCACWREVANGCGAETAQRPPVSACRRHVGVTMHGDWVQATNPISPTSPRDSSRTVGCRLDFGAPRAAPEGCTGASSVSVCWNASSLDCSSFLKASATVPPYPAQWRQGCQCRSTCRRRSSSWASEGPADIAGCRESPTAASTRTKQAVIEPSRRKQLSDTR